MVEVVCFDLVICSSRQMRPPRAITTTQRLYMRQSLFSDGTLELREAKSQRLHSTARI